MPLTRGRDRDGPYYRWGPATGRGKKYHYAAGDAGDREAAKARARRQGRAVATRKGRGARGGGEKSLTTRARGGGEKSLTTRARGGGEKSLTTRARAKEKKRAGRARAARIAARLKSHARKPRVVKKKK